jgi:glyoxylase-like metal-dependent hydrolase (beta-lactamase superfamily II)
VLRIGRYELAGLLDGTFALDGGAMFGAVPRTLWEPLAPPDALHRIRLAVRCLLARDRDAGRVILVDSGLGGRWEGRAAERCALDRSVGGLEAALVGHGLSPADVTDLVLTHLHLDHAGGVARRRPDGSLELTFPRAVHHVQRRAWLWAHAPTEKDRSSFRPEDFELLGHSSQLHLLDDETDLFPDVELIVSEGHTAGQQLPRFHGDGTHLTFCGDLIPTHHHMKPSWGMAYDLHPLTTVEEKKVLLAEALEDDGVLFFDHDPQVAACRLREADGLPVFREAVEL